MIGGLISSTVLSLLFVPAVFALMDDVRGGRGACSAAWSGQRTKLPTLRRGRVQGLLRQLI